MVHVDPADFADLEFPVGHCAECDREVLTYVSYGSEGQDLLCCVHCDVPLVAPVAAATGAALPDIGYGLLELQGCGNPDCGGGQCARAMTKESAAEQDESGSSGAG